MGRTCVMRTIGNGLFISGLLVLHLLPKHATAADYLYSVLPFEESDPVLEFEPPPADAVHNAQGEDVTIRPDFLYSREQGHRVVLYYLPWCPHCQAYVPTYIALARRVQEMVQDGDTKGVEFYAVSCSKNHQVCKDQHVGGIPSIKIFKAGSETGTPADPMKLHPFQIMRILGIPYGGSVDDWDNNVGRRAARAPAFLKGRQWNGKRNKHDVFEDAYRSFHFVMETGIYTANGPLEEKPKQALANWILLLQNALPITSWRMQALLQELVDAFDAVTKEESDLVAVLAKYPPTSKDWSDSCSHSKEGEGFTCGLWELFHIITVGVVQFNENAISSNEKSLYHTSDVAQTLRDFIELFFACNVCRKEFLQSFDSCAHDRCRRLVDTVGVKQDWVELPIWLWMEHNSVNARLLREHAAQDQSITQQDIEHVEWPSRKICPACWQVDGDFSFDRKIVHEYLLEEYWPGLAHSGAKERGLFGASDDADASILAIPFVLLLLPLIGPAFLLFKWYRKKQSGRHKKLDL